MCNSSSYQPVLSGLDTIEFVIYVLGKVIDFASDLAVSFLVAVRVQ